MERYLQSAIYEDSANKIVLLSGPRQSGKTTLVKSLFQDYTYLNYDAAEDYEMIRNKKWRRDSECLILDELHKMPEWKRWLKGIFDTEGNHPRLLVTGSANLDMFTKVGDSLAGRYFQFRLHPIDIKEAVSFWQSDPKLAFQHLINYGGFPEPFLAGNDRFYRRWQKTHLDIILKQDMLDLYAVRSIQQIEILMELLKSRVASTISYANLANDLQVDAKTVKGWLQALENFYLIFPVRPYHHNLARAILKEPKYYFFDIARVKDYGARLENLVACALLKEIHLIEDTEGFSANLHYLRTKDGQELDFLITIDNKPVICIEVKASDSQVSRNFAFFREKLNIPNAVQLVADLSREYDTPDGVHVRDLASFLAGFSLVDYVSTQIFTE